MNSQGLIRHRGSSRKPFTKSQSILSKYRGRKEGLLSQSVLESHWQKDYQILSYLTSLVFESEYKDKKIVLVSPTWFLTSAQGSQVPCFFSFNCLVHLHRNVVRGQFCRPCLEETRWKFPLQSFILWARINVSVGFIAWFDVTAFTLLSSFCRMCWEMFSRPFWSDSHTIQNGDVFMQREER